jgi:o-succinylbenzoate synthase
MNSPFRLEKLDWKRVELPLAKPLQTSAGRFARRDILVIRATVRIGSGAVVGYGESSPLVGWTDESIDDDIVWLESAPTGVDFDSIRMLDDAFGSSGSDTLEQSPSLRFGVELALLDALARHREVPLCRLLAAERGRLSPSSRQPQSKAPLGSVPVQYTIGAGSLEQTLTAAQHAKDQGYGCVKLKVGAAPLAADIDRIGQVCKALPSLKIRLDANGAWQPDEAIQVLRSLSDNHIDLVEQPVGRGDFSGLLSALGDQEIPVAPDESCVPIAAARQLVRESKIEAMVLKPQALGGLLPVCKLIDDATRRGIRVVLSTLIESAIGRSAVAHLAAAHPDLEGPHGLATGPWFSRDICDTPDRLEAGRLGVRSGPGIGFVPVGFVPSGRPQ